MRIWAALLLAAGPVHAACGDGYATRISEGAQSVAFRSVPAAMPVDRHFKLELQLCPASAKQLRVDADMPAHRHGMNYRVKLTPLGAGRYHAEGLLFHMPGRWRLIFDMVTADGPLRLTHEVDVQ